MVETREAGVEAPAPAPWRWSLLAAGGYLLLAVAFTWPLVLHWNALLLGDQELPAFMWRAWWMKRIMLDGWSLAADLWDRLAVVLLSAHYPEAGNLNDMALGLPLQAWLGFPAGHNAKALGIIVFNAMAGYWLGRDLTRSRSCGFVAGAVLAFNPYTAEMMNIGRLRESIVGFEALAALFLYRVIVGPGGVRNALAAGLFSALTAAFYWFYGHYLILWTLVLLAWRVASGPRTLTLHMARDLALTAWVAAIVILPFGAPYVSQAQSGRLGDDMASPNDLPSLSRLLEWHDPNERDALVLNSLRRLLVERRDPEYAVLFDRYDSLALDVTLLALSGVVLAWRRALPWALSAALFYSMSLGPYLRWGGDWVLGSGGAGVELPHAFFFRHLPFFSRLYAPNRAESMLLVCLAALAAVGLARLFEACRAGTRERVLAIALVVTGIFWPMFMLRQLPMRVTPANVPQAYRMVAAMPGDGAVLELPAEASRDEINFYQSLHERPLAGGWATSPPTPVTLQTMRIGGGYQRASQAARELERGVTAALLQSLKAQGVRFVVVHERFFLQQDPTRGSESYGALCAQLEKRVGKPVAVDREAVPEANAFLPPGFGDHPVPEDRELRIFDLAPQ